MLADIDNSNVMFNSKLSCTERARRAVRGVVTDSEGRAVAGAAVRVEDRNKDVLTTEAGEFWR